METDTAKRLTGSDLEGLRLVLMFSLAIGAAFFAGGVQHLRQVHRTQSAIPLAQTDDYRSGFAKGWGASLTDTQLGRSAAPEQAFRELQLREDQYGEGFPNFRRGFLAGYVDGWTMDHAPNAPKIPKTAELQ